MSTTKPYAYNFGDIIKTSKTEWEILGRKLIPEDSFTKKRYLCRCLTCDSRLWKTEVDLKLGEKGRYGNGSCGVCSNRIVVTGKNDVATTHPHLVKYFKDPEDALYINAGSRDKRWFVCPICGYEVFKPVEYVVTHNDICCNVCDDHISYPNKFAYSVLSQLNVDSLEREYSIWENESRCSYDIYFLYNKKKYLLEMDGGFHFQKRFGRQIEDNEKRDKFKDDVAEKNGFILIRINCEKSELNYIKKNMEQSILSEIFDLSIVNWGKVENDCKKNILNEIAIYYSHNPNASLENISEKFHLCGQTVRTYLKRANNIGLIKYQGLLEIMDNRMNKAIQIKKEHPEYSNKQIADIIGSVTPSTIRNYLIKAQKANIISNISAKDYIREQTMDYIKNHLDLSNLEIANNTHHSHEYIEKLRKEVVAC